jgi:hypothetical protein
MAKVIVYHSYYGCDTGCCGHIVEMGDRTEFDFGHPFGDDARAFAEELIRAKFGEEHVKDLDWDNCEVVGNC